MQSLYKYVNNQKNPISNQKVNVELEFNNENNNVKNNKSEIISENEFKIEILNDTEKLNSKLSNEHEFETEDISNKDKIQSRKSTLLMTNETIMIDRHNEINSSKRSSHSRKNSYVSRRSSTKAEEIKHIQRPIEAQSIVEMLRIAMTKKKDTIKNDQQSPEKLKMNNLKKFINLSIDRKLNFINSKHNFKNFRNFQSSFKYDYQKNEFVIDKFVMDEYCLINFCNDSKLIERNNQFIDIKHNSLILNSEFNSVRIWSAIILCTIILSQILWPITISEQDFNRHLIFRTSMQLTDIIYFIDIWVNAITVESNSPQVNMNNNETVIKHYLSSQFIIDFIAFLPRYSFIKPIFNFPLTKLLKLIKWNVISKRLALREILLKISIVTNNNRILNEAENLMFDFGISDSLGNNINLLMSMIVVMYCMQWMTCLFVFFVRTSQVNWYYYWMLNEYLHCGNLIPIFQRQLECNSMYFIDFYDEFIQEHHYYLYKMSLYKSVVTIISVGQGDVATYSEAEKAADLFCIGLGVLCFEFMASFISNLIITESVFDGDNLNKRRIYNTLKTKYNLPPDATFQLERLIDNVAVVSLEAEFKFINRLPVSMKIQIMRQVAHVYKSKIPFFAQLSSANFEEVYKVLNYRKCSYQEDVQAQKEKANCIQFLYQGNVSYQMKVLEKQNITGEGKFQIIEVGNSLGLADCCLSDIQQVGARSKELSELVFINYQDLENLVYRQVNVQEFFKLISKQLRFLIKNKLVIQMILVAMQTSERQIRQADMENLATDLELTVSDQVYIWYIVSKIYKPDDSLDDLPPEEWYLKFFSIEIRDYLDVKIYEIYLRFVHRHGAKYQHIQKRTNLGNRTSVKGYQKQYDEKKKVKLSKSPERLKRAETKRESIINEQQFRNMFDRQSMDLDINISDLFIGSNSSQVQNFIKTEINLHANSRKSSNYSSLNKKSLNRRNLKAASRRFTKQPSLNQSAKFSKSFDLDINYSCARNKSCDILEFDQSRMPINKSNTKELYKDDQELKIETKNKVNDRKQINKSSVDFQKKNQEKFGILIKNETEFYENIASYSTDFTTPSINSMIDNNSISSFLANNTNKHSNNMIEKVFNITNQSKYTNIENKTKKLKSPLNTKTKFNKRKINKKDSLNDQLCKLKKLKIRTL